MTHSEKVEPDDGAPGKRLLLLVLAPVLSVVAALSLGRYGLDPKSLLHYTLAFFSQAPTPEAETMGTVLWQVRLPRILAAIIIGGGLSLAGAAYQGIFRNPMVSPEILGASTGAGCGATLGLLLEADVPTVQGLAFCGGILAVAATCLVTKLIGRAHQTILVLVLSGMVISALCSALTSLIKLLADPDSKLPAITFWLMGSLSTVTMRDVVWLLPSFIAGSGVLWLIRWRIDLLSLGDDQARSLGVSAASMRWLCIVAATLLSAVSVSVAGMVGWVGLVIPHLARLIVGASHRRLLPASLLLGSAFLLLVDTLARSLSAQEIPLGVLTALVGAPFFLVVLSRSRGEG